MAEERIFSYLPNPGVWKSGHRRAHRQRRVAEASRAPNLWTGFEISTPSRTSHVSLPGQESAKQ